MSPVIYVKMFVQWGSDIRTNPVIERPFWPITGYSISKQLWRPSLFRYPDIRLSKHAITGLDISHSRNKDGGQNLISELKSVRISRFAGYRASGYRILTVVDNIGFLCFKVCSPYSFTILYKCLTHAYHSSNQVCCGDSLGSLALLVTVCSFHQVICVGACK
jgi:hypothetical protein